MDLSRSENLVDPKKLPQKVAIIGCGAIGSHVAICIAAMGVPEIILFDGDVVAEENLSPAGFFQWQIGAPKVEALAELVKGKNPQCVVRTEGNYFNQSIVADIVFIAVDSLKVRQDIASMLGRWNIHLLADLRMGDTLLSQYTFVGDEISKYPGMLEGESTSELPCGNKATAFICYLSAFFAGGLVYDWANEKKPTFEKFADGHTRDMI